MRRPWIWSSTWKIPTKSPNSFLQIQNVSTNFGAKIVKWCKLSHVSPPRKTTLEVQTRNCFDCIQMLLGTYKHPFTICGLANPFSPPAWKLFLLDSMWMKRWQCLFCDLDSRKSNKESRQQHDVMATRLELEKLGSRCWRQRCYLNPQTPPIPRLRTHNKTVVLFWFRDQIDVLS